MIYYRPTEGDPLTTRLRKRPRACFLMTQLGEPIPPILLEIRTALTEVLQRERFELIDANSLVTGRDFLLKIWEIIVSVPLGVAILHEEMKPTTVANIFYELGLMQAYGKETLVIKTAASVIPSDFVRTEYVQYGPDFQAQLRKFFQSLEERADYYALMADQVERNPLLSIDYLRRAYLLTGDQALKDRARATFDAARLSERAKNSVEMLLIDFD
ncbi:MAG TPA: hypothetical protein VJT67_12040 [Longimicrobiaceae bacterium]|nr:hypothetical protein [Longimicrobiaceae bacterium]